MIQRILETILYCRALDEAERFYAGTLGLRRVSDARPRGLTFRVSPDAVLILFNPDLTPLPHPDVPAHGAPGHGHVGFGVEAGSLERWRRRLEDAGCPIEREVRWPTGARSLYVRDPERHSVELIDGDPWPA